MIIAMSILWFAGWWTIGTMIHEAHVPILSPVCGVIALCIGIVGAIPMGCILAG